MWERFKRWLYLEYYWRRRKHGRTSVRTHKSVRSGRSFGAMAIVVILAGVVIFVLLSKIIASIYRSFIPFVPGPQIADAYWSSIVAALKLSLVLIGIISVCILLLFIKFTKKRK